MSRKGITRLLRKTVRNDGMREVEKAGVRSEEAVERFTNGYDNDTYHNL